MPHQGGQIRFQHNKSSTFQLLAKYESVFHGMSIPRMVTMLVLDTLR
jgi:hypothetical protein